MDFPRARIEFMGDSTAGRIVVGDDGVEPLVGVTALEWDVIEVNPVDRSSKHLPVLRLKRPDGRPEPA